MQGVLFVPSGPLAALTGEQTRKQEMRILNDISLHQRKTGPQILAVLIYVIFPLLPLLSVSLSPGWTAQAPYAKLGNSLALIVFSILALQPVLAARLKYLDRLFGLDIIYVFHKIMGMTAAVLQICVLVFFAAGPGPYLSWPGMVGTALIIILVLSALLYRELRLTYESWRRLHNLLFMAVLITLFLQVWQIAYEKGSPVTAAVVSAHFIVASALYAYHKFIGPSQRGKTLYRVVSVNRETKNVWTLTFAPPQGTPHLSYLPGQFQFITFAQGRGEEHPFTIPSSPAAAGQHTATIKESGDFTRSIGRIQAGDKVAVQAPFGRFSYLLHPEERDLVFIAGGIGITPFMSMLRHMRDTKADKNVLLLYANNTEDDIVFRGELDAMAGKTAPQLRVVHVLGRAEREWSGEQGFIDRAKIEKHVIGDIKNKTFYLCGPPPMMTALIAVLIELGVPSKRIRSERFAL